MFKHVLMNQAGEGGTSGGGTAPNIGDAGGDGGMGGNPAGASGSAGGSPSSGAPVASGAAPQNWLEALSEDIRKDPSLQMFKEPSALAKSWVNAQKMIGADKVMIPNDKSTEEDWNAFYQKLGRPESADKYEIKPPDGQELDKNFSNGFKEAAYKSGLSPKQVSALAEWYNGAAQAAVESSKTAQVSQLRDSLKAYSEKLGGDDAYMKRVDEAKVAVRALANPALNEYLKKSGVGSHPEMIEFFAGLKSMMDEDKIRDGTGVSFQGEDPAVLQREIEDIEKKMFTDMNNPNRPTWVEQRSKLYDRLNAARVKTG